MRVMQSLVLVAVLALAAVGISWAEDKAKGPNPIQACQDQLALTSVQANNLANDRAVKEQALAKEQVVTYMLKQKVAQLEKAIETMKKAVEPPVEEKKVE